MNMKRIASFLIVISLLLTAGLPISADGADSTEQIYSQTALQNWTALPDNAVEANISSALSDGASFSGDNTVLTAGSTVGFYAKLPKDGEYNILITFTAVNNDVAMDNILKFKADGGEETELILDTLWTDASRGETDRNGNETIPDQVTADGFGNAYLTDGSDINRSRYALNITAGYHEFTLKETVQDIEISRILFVQSTKLPKYEKTIDGKEIVFGTDDFSVEAEKYSLKSDSYIRGKNVQNSSLTPYDTHDKKINVLSGDSWNTPGQKVLWEFEIKDSGWYHLGIRYQQESGTRLPVFRTLEIDGEVPFEEWQDYLFESTGSNSYKTESLTVDGEAMAIYLEKGTHTLAMTVSIGYLKEIYNEIIEIISEINTLGTKISKLTAGTEDANRTWDMDVYMPEAQDTIYSFAERIDAISEKIDLLTDNNSTFADDLVYASELLNKLADDKKHIPNNSEMLCRGDNSATNYLINALTAFTAQSLSLDKLYVYGDRELTNENAGFFRSFWESLKRFFRSFSPEAMAEDYNISQSKDSDELVVWVGQTPMCVDILQQMVDKTYNKEHGTNVRLLVMPSEQKLILANSVGNNPDIVISSVSPYKYAIRGAAKNLLEYDDFFDFYTQDYTLESLVPHYYNGGVYGVTESRAFSVLFYRKDTLSALGLEVPETWDDVKAMMPTLLRNSMNFCIPTSGSGAYALGNVSPFIFQNDADVYSEDGLSGALDTENTIAALTEITEFHKVYGVQTSIASFFNSFRYNQIPIGIAGYDFYLQLNMAAPEISGLWDIALVPGTRQEDGSILRYQPTNSSASMIFENSDKHEEAWEFLKWWLSSETQSEYSRRRQTANASAFETLPFSSEHKAIIRETYKNQMEMVSHPASYIVEREIGNVWNNVVISNESLVDNINSSTILVNREFKRKMQEFGFIDSDGNIIKDYSANALEELKAKAKEG